MSDDVIDKPAAEIEHFLEDGTKAVQRLKPDISHLDEALDVDDEGNVKFLPIAGGKVVIERCIEDGTWLDTNLYTIRTVDHDTGALMLIRDEYGHLAMSNYLEGIVRGYVFKLPPPKGTIIRKKVRSGAVEKPKKVVTQHTGPVRKGRPKGTKNRPHNIVAAEKAQRKAEKTQRKIARAARIYGKGTSRLG